MGRSGEEPRQQSSKSVDLQLVFDSADQAPAVGVRRGLTASRHLLYKADRWCIDLRMDRLARSRRISLVGQLADLGDPLCPLAEIPVFLKASNKLFAQTLSNRQGEFQLEYEPGRAVMLCLPDRHEGWIEAPLLNVG